MRNVVEEGIGEVGVIIDVTRVNGTTTKETTEKKRSDNKDLRK